MAPLKQATILAFFTILIFTLPRVAYADIYDIKNNRVQKSASKKKKPLSTLTLSEIAYQQDERVSNLKAQLIKSQSEQKRLKKELDELKESFKRFKNYYFRRY